MIDSEVLCRLESTTIQLERHGVQVAGIADDHTYIVSQPAALFRSRRIVKRWLHRGGFAK